MQSKEEVLKRDFVYWDISSQEVVLEKENTKPDWSYVELWKGVLDDIIIEHYKDGDKRLEFAYGSNTPDEKINKERQYHLLNNRGNWTCYMVRVPVWEFEKTIRLYYFED